jgi:hypothetical protein
MGNKELSIKKNRQHWAKDTERRQTKQKNTTQKIKMMTNTDLIIASKTNEYNTAT